ncbi:MAG TPA: MMPL family transporter, partial [Candidatus Polarisedimenticolia bacterium]|nr:MMPL family transporter [Candidatus Polarisedimenticolia bacterium]
VVVNLTLYRSVRTLAAFLITLAVCASLTVGVARLIGFSFTIVSALVPLTIVITATAALVYIQSRFAEHADGTTVQEHQVFTLANKFVATTASIFAAAIGFAALAVSGIRPIREMGLWVATGLAGTWVVIFTLFPALQRVLATPTLRRRTASGRVMLRVFDALPLFTYRRRWPILALTALLMALGAVALTGIPGVVPPMSLEIDSLAYIDRSLPLYEDTRHFEQAISGLSVVQVWVSVPEGGVLQPELLRGLEEFALELERDPRVGSVMGPTSLLRWIGYAQGQGDRLPRDAAAWEGLAAQLDQVLLEEPAARGFVDIATMAEARLTVIHRGGEFGSVEEIKTFIRRSWDAAAARAPGLGAARMRVVGEGLLQGKIAEYLVPTLTESFALTAAVIFVAFLIVFRSGAARLMAMIPSVFAILVMFLVMRLIGIPLNIATILIASTVLGASENDQIHFFYHYQEKRSGATTEQALRHALMIAGRGILFATLINACGFLALALSGLPPMRQFGIITSSAFALSMIASLLALPASLWVFTRQHPDP